VARGVGTELKVSFSHNFFSFVFPFGHMLRSASSLFFEFKDQGTNFCSCRCFWLFALLSGPVLLSLMHTSLPHPVVSGMGKYVYG